MTWSIDKECFARLLAFVLIIIGLLFLSFFVASEALYTYLCIVASIFIIGCVLVFRRSLDLFEPLSWFLLMSSFFYVFSILICIIGFDFLYHDNFAVRNDRYAVLLCAVVVFTMGVVSFIFGDYLAESFTFKFERKELVHCLGKDSLLIVGGGLVSLGVLNFFVNSYAYNSSDVFMLLKDFGARDHRIHEGNFYSTFGYNFLIIGLFFLMLRRVTHFRSLGFFYKAIFLICLVILLSTGRIWYTLSLVFVFMALAHFSGMRIRLRTMFFYCVVLGCAVLIIYFARLYSNLVYIDSSDALGGSFVDGFATRIVEFIFGRSNVPSVPILMEVIDYYSTTQDFVAGKTLVYWLTYFAPGFDVTFLGHEIKERFYPGRPGGFPPTIFGELYANGGFLFVIMASFYFGFLIKMFYIFVGQRNNFLLYFIYSAMLFRFVFMLPKLESSALGSAVWLFLPTVAACFFLHIFLLGLRGKDV
ncbi:O-antigen polymerase [Ectopseudomonas hydrolytica]|uniref:O-antigen polymerase n=1 Tax=Ectopseudomonas hydrolytica TaxID=2493633 RepID=UPI003C2B1E28